MTFIVSGWSLGEDDMGMVYTPDEEHFCALPDRNGMREHIGAIWQCDDCGTYFAFGYTEDSWGPVWYRVRWWHFRIRRRIREARPSNL
jgi:ribosomal protein L37AE/L43A